MGDTFETLGSQVASYLQSYLEKSNAPAQKVLPLGEVSCFELSQKYRQQLTTEGGHSVSQSLELFLDHSTKLHSAKNMGHQVSVPEPISSFFEWAAALANQGSAIFEVGASSNAMERALVTELLSRLHFPQGEGFATHGGTVGNLTALLTARNVCFPSAWEDGVGEDGLILAGADSHYSISRAAGILGLGVKQVVKVGLDAKRRMDVQELQRQIDEARGRKKKIIAVVAASGTTPVGAFDPLNEIADICERERLWLHVDGAHGASVLLCDRYRHLLDGIHRADSVVWDAHKLLGVAALCTFVFYREKRNAFRTFAQEAPYLFNENDPIDIDAAHKTVECTRRALTVALFGLWAVKGSQYFSSHIEKLFSTTKMFYALLKESPDFEVLHEPECNILCFRYRPIENQRELRKRLVTEGNFYMTQAVLEGNGVLRVTISNPLTQKEHLIGLLSEIRRVGSLML